MDNPYIKAWCSKQVNSCTKTKQKYDPTILNIKKYNICDNISTESHAFVYVEN